MELKLIQPETAALDVDALVLFEAEGTRTPAIEKTHAALYDSGELSGKVLELTVLHSVAGFKARRVLIAGAGKPEKFDAAAARKLAAAAIRLLKGKGVKTVAIAADEHLSAIVEGAITGAWEPDYLKTDPDKNKKIQSVLIASSAKDAQAAVDRGRIVAEAINLSRDISVQPPNLLTPLAMAERAQSMCKEEGLSCEVLDRDRMQQLGMGALLGVAIGSAAPPAFIVMKYAPQNKGSDVHLAFIGKGVTFDTGGISIKPSEGMEKMKYDMAGGASVIGAMQAIARLKPNVTVTGIVPAVENMPGSRAQRPGDIVTSLSGKTIEILNTDAEGRLILADAITYAKQLGCTHIVDTATLTGAIVVALGYASSGAFTNNDEFLAQWMTASKGTGDAMWHMPLYDEYREQLKTVYADIQNIGGRWGGACTAAMFLKEFVGDTPWIHVDIAGTAWLDDAKPYLAKGPTGTPLGAFVNLAMNWRSDGK